MDKKSKERKEGEHAVTPGTRDWVHGNLLDDDRTFGLKVVNTEYPIYYFVMLRFLQDVFFGNQYYCTPIFSSWIVVIAKLLILGDLDYSMYVVLCMLSEVQSVLWRDYCVFHVLFLCVYPCGQYFN